MSKSVLIIDDSDTIREQIVQTIKEAALFDLVYQAGDGIEAFKLLLGNRIDLIICDLEMPRIDGIKLLGMIATREELRDIPVIMLTGREDRELKIRLLGQGASDYVTKPFDAGELVARVRVHLKIKSLQDELKQSNEMLKQLSNTDPLTKLYNRRYMLDMLEKEIQRAKRKGTRLSLILMDIDHFKKVNDLYGHQSGDQVLVTVAKLAAADLRGYDFTARYGGEEFVIALPETGHDDALMIAERVRHRIELHNFSGMLGTLRVTISMGVATCPTDFIGSIDDLIREADTALYRAKAAGRNRVVSMNRT
ncbi:MAG TPA: diguanylate cyclase [Geobacteraceae bacterium]|nr:diguanylate cyclase [Geobacteraceae bacterium]